MDFIDFLSYLLFGPDNVCCAIVWLIPAIMAAVSIASTAIGAAKQSEQTRKNQNELDRQKLEADNEYLREYYKGLDSTENRAYLKKLDSRMKRTDRALDNRAVASNATHENALAAKQKANEVYSDAVSDIVSNNERNKRSERSNWLSRKTALTSQQMGINSQIGQNWANIASGISNAAMNLGMSYAYGGGELFGGNAAGTGTINPNNVYD